MRAIAVTRFFCWKNDSTGHFEKEYAATAGFDSFLLDIVHHTRYIHIRDFQTRKSDFNSISEHLDPNFEANRRFCQYFELLHSEMHFPGCCNLVSKIGKIKGFYTSFLVKVWLQFQKNFHSISKTFKVDSKAIFLDFWRRKYWKSELNIRLMD